MTLDKLIEELQGIQKMQRERGVPNTVAVIVGPSNEGDEISTVHLETWMGDDPDDPDEVWIGID